MNCPDADKGAEDFAAGRKDEARYNDAVNGGDYRRGWQLARLGSYQAPANAPAPVSAQVGEDTGGLGTTPPVAEECPFGSAAPLPDPEPADPGPKPAIPPSESAPPVSRQSVLLVAGELKPRKPKPADPGQLGLF